jgi:hypothetical protein
LFWDRDRYPPRPVSGFFAQDDLERPLIKSATAPLWVPQLLTRRSQGGRTKSRPFGESRRLSRPDTDHSC